MLGGLAQAAKSGWTRVKDWWRGLTGSNTGREDPGFARAANELYEKCDMRSRARGGVRIEDED